MLTVLAASRLFAQSPPPPLTVLDAVRAALENNPTLKVQRAQVGIDNGVVMQASGLFDTNLQAGLTQTRADTPLPSAVQQADNLAGEVTNTTLLSAGGNRLFRNGVAIGGSYSVERLRDNYTTPLGINASQTALTITLPLMRGRGSDAVAAQENSSRVEAAASLLDLNQLISQLIEQTATDYWNVQAAQRNLEIARDAEERGGVYVDNVKALIQADHAPPGDLNEVTANLADRSANRIAAEQALVAARAQLALDIGFGPFEMTALPQISDPFPLASGQDIPSDHPSDLKFYIEQSLQRRPDVLAARQRIKEASILKVAAANARLPQLNVNLGTGYVLSNEGKGPENFFKAPFTGQVAGPTAVGGITFTFPPANDAARGQYVQASETEKQYELRSFDTERTISSGLMVAVENVRTGIARAEKARESVQSFRAALEGEREKYRVGLGSVVAILTVEDSLTNALLNEVLADQAYAISIVQFRFFTGTLIDASRTTQDVQASVFSSLPFYSEPSRGHTP